VGPLDVALEGRRECSEASVGVAPPGLAVRVGRVPELELLRLDHADALLAFELENRAYFAGFISDRGDEYFERFGEELRARVAEQATEGAYFVLVDDGGSVLGRFNLIFTEPGSVDLGYRVAEHAAGRGVATEAVRQLCRIAASEYGVRVVRAATSTANVASQRVLAKAGFVPDGPADPADIGGKQGSWYRRDLPA
jgi:ribosomal-protein-alanine N-acetyltransferase